MKFACTQENLSQGLHLVSHISGKNANLPILSNVLLKAEEGNLKLSTTNLEMAVSVLVRGKMEAAGEFTVPAKLLQDYVGLLSSGKVELVQSDDLLEVVADGRVTKMKGVAASEFPLIPKLAKGKGYKLKAEALKRAISQVAFAVSAAESRPELSGVACFFSGGKLIMAATDSYRLSECELGLEAGSAEAELRCIVPARAMQEVARIVGGYRDDMATPDEVEWAMTDNQLVVTYGNVELITRLIEGSFPDYHQIIPTAFRSTLTLSRQELVQAIRAAALFARQGLQDVHFKALEGGGLEVSASDSGTGTHATTLKASLEGDANTVTLNYRYVSDGLSAMEGDEVCLRMIDGMSPVVAAPKQGGAFRYIVMPIRQ